MNLKNQQELNGPSSWVVQHAAQVPSGMVLIWPVVEVVTDVFS